MPRHRFYWQFGGRAKPHPQDLSDTIYFSPQLNALKTLDTRLGILSCMLLACHAPRKTLDGHGMTFIA